MLLPDEPDHVAEGFDVNKEFDEPADGGSGTWFNHVEGRRMLRLWGLSLGMTLYAILLHQSPTLSDDRLATCWLIYRPHHHPL